MMSVKSNKIFTLLILIFLYFLSGCHDKAEDRVFEIGLALSLSGKYTENSQEAYKAISLYLEDVNQEMVGSGIQIKLIPYDDQGSEDIAVKNTEAIKDNPKLIGVIGHNSSSRSISASPFYEKYAIPVISSFSTRPELTENNPWYFRTIIDDATAAKALAVHMKEIMGIKKTVVIYVHDVYGNSVNSAFRNAAQKLDMSVEYSFPIIESSTEAGIQHDLKGIIKKQEKDSAFVIATYGEDLYSIIEFIRNQGMDNPIIIAGDAIAVHPLSARVEFPIPPHLNYNLYATSPLLYDSAGLSLNNFIRKFQGRYQKAPNTYSILSVDATIVFIEALSGFLKENASDLNIDKIREGIKLEISNFSTYSSSVNALSGAIYFERNGNIVQNTLVGVLGQNKIISHPIQLLPFNENLMPSKSNFSVDRNNYIKTEVVYTGVDIKNIDNCNFELKECDFDFDVWFRNSNSFDINDIKFVNLVDDLVVDKNTIEEKSEITNYIRYSAHGRFKMDYLDYNENYSHDIGIYFHHVYLSKEQLIFVKDMGDKEKNSLKKTNDWQVGSLDGWHFFDEKIYIDDQEIDNMGMQKIISNDGMSFYSQFNYSYKISKNASLLAKAPLFYLMLLFVFLWVTIFFIFYKMIRKKESKLNFIKWSLVTVGIYLLFHVAEILLYFHASGFVADTQVYRMGKVIDALRWIIPVILALMLFDQYVWIPFKDKISPEKDNEIGGEGGGEGASRFTTVIPLLRITFYVIVLSLAFLMGLSHIGVDITPILAGAGVLGIALGFGSQRLVADVISGMFFLFDDAFRSGEYVEVGETIGTVEKISLRSFQLRHHKGAVHTIPYGEISKLTNYSRDWVIMKLRFTVPFDSDIHKIKKIFKNIGQEMIEIPEYRENLIQPFKSQGVIEVNDIGIVIRGKFMARPGKQFTLRKDIYQRVKKAFEENGLQFARKEVRVRVESDELATPVEMHKRAAAAAAESEDR